MAGQAILMDHLFGVGHRTSPFPKNSPHAGEFIGQGPVRRAHGAGGDMRWASLRWVAWKSSNMSGSGRSKTFPSRRRQGPGARECVGQGKRLSVLAGPGGRRNIKKDN